MGIDPGSRCTGWGVVELKGNKINYVDSGVLRFNAALDFLPRLSQIQNKLFDLSKQFTINELSLESLIYVKSPTALIKLAQTRGVILSVFLPILELSIFEYSPNLIKSTIAGHGHADKESIQKFVRLVLGPVEFETHDESDALAIAICHALKRNERIIQPGPKSRTSGLAASVAHRLKEERS